MLTPSVRFQAEQNNTQVFIRGVGANLDFANVEQSVGFVINGAYIPREGTSAAFFDLARLEVLPGPQGTLYGRSSIGGTVALTSNRPAQNWDGNVLLELEDYSGVHAGYAQNIPLTKSLALAWCPRLPLSRGLQRVGGDSKDDYGVRLSALYEPSDAFSFFVWTHYAEKNGHPQNLVNKGLIRPRASTARTASCMTTSGTTRARAIWRRWQPFGSAVADDQQYETFMAGGEMNWSVGPGVLTWIPSYFYVDSAPNYWLGTIRARLATHYNQVANELRYSNPDSDGIRYLAGLYLYRVRSDNLFTLFTNQPFELRSVNNPFQPDRERGGVRSAYVPDLGAFTADRGRPATASTSVRRMVCHPTPSEPYRLRSTRSLRTSTGRRGSNTTTSDESLLYAQVQTGYKPGTYNFVPSTPDFNNLVKPTDLMAFTAGYKTRLLGRQSAGQRRGLLLRLRGHGGAVVRHQFTVQRGSSTRRRSRSTVPARRPVRGHGQCAAEPERRLLARTQQGVRHAGRRRLLRLEPRTRRTGRCSRATTRVRGRRAARCVQRSVRDSKASGWPTTSTTRGTMQDDSWKADASLTYESPRNWTVGVMDQEHHERGGAGGHRVGGHPGPATAYLEEPRTYGLRATFDF
jgi:iron complex outermembrane receptor protein